LHDLSFFAVLNDRGRVGVPVVMAALLIPACLAGCWLGFCLGSKAIGRAFLRGFFVGALEAGACAALLKPPEDHPDPLVRAWELMYVNFVCFWFFATISSAPRDILIQTEAEWQAVVRRNAPILRIIRLSLGLDELKGISTRDGILVWIIRGVETSILAAILGWVWAHFSGIFKLAA
jgi:hypothetical protein